MQRALLLELTDARGAGIALAAPDDRGRRATTVPDLHLSPVASGSGGDSLWHMPPAQIMTQKRSLFRSTSMVALVRVPSAAERAGGESLEPTSTRSATIPTVIGCQRSPRRVRYRCRS